MKRSGTFFTSICSIFLLNSAAHAGDQFFTKSIYRLENQRYEKFSTESGTVFLLSTSFSYEEKLKSGICEKSTKSMKEVLKIKDNEVLSADDKKNEAAIRGLVASCGSGKNDVETNEKKKDGIEIKLTPTKPDGTTPEPGVSVKKNWP